VNEDRWAGFKARLDEVHDWPDSYTFKVVAPVAQVDRVLALMGDPEHSRRVSKNGTYVSLTVEFIAQGSDEVLELYRKVSVVDGVILL